MRYIIECEEITVCDECFAHQENNEGETWCGITKDPTEFSTYDTMMLLSCPLKKVED